MSRFETASIFERQRMVEDALAKALHRSFYLHIQTDQGERYLVFQVTENGFERLPLEELAREVERYLS